MLTLNCSTTEAMHSTVSSSACDQKVYKPCIRLPMPQNVMMSSRELRLLLSLDSSCC